MSAFGGKADMTVCGNPQFNRKTFHAAGQRYKDASHGCDVVIIPRRIHFGPSGDDLECSGGEQHGHNDH
jgi:hypothetical protein